jgi:hypothetical protein
VSVETFTRRNVRDRRLFGRCLDAKKSNRNRQRRARHCGRIVTLCHCCVERKRGRLAPGVKDWATTLAILTVLSATLALAEDFKTIKGKEYKNATVSRVEPDGIVLKTKSGIAKVYFTELPKEVQERFLPQKTGAAQRGLTGLKSSAAAVANPTSFVLLFVAGVSLIAAVAFTVVRFVSTKRSQRELGLGPRR